MSYHSVGSRAGGAVRGVLGLVGGVIRFVTGLFVAILVLHIALTLFGANTGNAAFQIIAVLAYLLALGLQDLFVVTSPFWQVILSYGIPAILWSVIGSVLVGLLRMIGRPQSGLA